MTKILNITIIGSFAGLWVATLFSSKAELILGFLLILTFGIIHGSNDLLLIEKLFTKEKKRSFLKSLFFYVLTVLLTFLAFYTIPSITVILFIIFSAYHFGEQHWESKVDTKYKWLSLILQGSYGALILIILFLFNAEQVDEIVMTITGAPFPPAFLLYSLYSILTLLVVTVAILAFNSDIFRKVLLKELFFLGLLVVIFKMSSLIWGFTIYFVLWHSLPSLFEQIHFIYGRFTNQTIWLYIKNALPYWIISIIGIGLSYFWLKESVLFFAIFFSFIAAVTFPHSLIISLMFKKKNNNTKTH
ncbi:Brp/Blh family beta-carotene 15,15'-dioxygenase [Dokdonia sp. Asnod1-B02]|uniref:Brp/Blh family beta-carotene 15,15'-dioxygenase n=1 Tax=Dokdonia sp. Asnod1-B02 TaxID=3160573 RepID=UPI00386479BD